MNPARQTPEDVAVDAGEAAEAEEGVRETTEAEETQAKVVGETEDAVTVSRTTIAKVAIGRRLPNAGTAGRQVTYQRTIPSRRRTLVVVETGHRVSPTQAPTTMKMRVLRVRADA